MLKHLSIKNYILIKELDIDFQPGFTVITGETGAGKSIMIGALSLILGKRADTDVLLDKESKCVIEGKFNINGLDLNNFFEEHDLDFEEITVMRREISRTGKSRAFINDTPVNLYVMKELGERLVDIHSQHQSLMLSESGFQMALLDNFAGNYELLQQYSLEYNTFRDAAITLENLLEKEETIRAEEEYTRFRFDELEHTGLRHDELHEMEEEQEMLENAEEIKGNLYRAAQILEMSDENIIGKLSEVTSITTRVADYHKEIRELSDRLKSAGIEIKDISNALSRLEENIQHDPLRLEIINQRLDTIYGLMQKHKVNNINDLLQIRDSLSKKLDSIDKLDEEIRFLKSKKVKAEAQLNVTANKLSLSRKNAIPAMERELASSLDKLGMSGAVFKVVFSKLNEFSANGLDQLEFTFSANPGSSPAAISRIASGGELSRLMLALKSLITRKNLLPTIILDEIDMGVSGDIAGRVGNMLDGMSQNMQLIAITHLPQIAGKASEHFRVFKKYTDDRTVSGVECLSDSERIDEIAAMLSNETVSVSAKETARELLGKYSEN